MQRLHTKLLYKYTSSASVLLFGFKTKRPLPLCAWLTPLLELLLELEVAGVHGTSMSKT